MPAPAVAPSNVPSPEILAKLQKGEYAEALCALDDVNNHPSLEALALRMVCHSRLEQWDRALEIESTWREQVGEVEGQHALGLYAKLVAAPIYARRGNRKRAAQIREELSTELIATHDRPERWGSDVHYWYAETLAAEDDLPSAQPHMQAALASAHAPGQSGGIVTEGDMYMTLLDWAAQQRDKDGLHFYIPLVVTLARRNGHKLFEAIAEYAEGVERRLAVEYEDAEGHLNHALEFFQIQSMQWHLGLTQYELGEVHLYRNNPTKALEYLERARIAFSAIGSTPSTDRTLSAIKWTRGHFGI